MRLLSSCLVRARSSSSCCWNRTHSQYSQRHASQAVFARPRVHVEHKNLAGLPTHFTTSNTFKRHCSDSVTTAAKREIQYTETCSCSADIAVPDLGDLEIDTKSRLNGVITRHYRHVVIHTGHIDWPSKVEDEEGSLATVLKPLVSRGGIFADPLYPLLISNSSLPPAAKEAEGTTISVFPAGIRIKLLKDDMASISSFIRHYLLHPSNPHFVSSPATHQVERITSPVILTCSHGARDQRCGILGPLISDAFLKSIAKRDKYSASDTLRPVVGDISHIGGHKFAGNVIIHLPAEHALTLDINNAASQPLPLAVEDTGDSNSAGPSDGEGGVSIWYGRIMPHHADSILEETIENGRVVRDVLRGALNSQGELVEL